MDQVIGIGGESILLRKKIEYDGIMQNCVIKLAPIEGAVDGVLGFFHSEACVEKDRPSELIPNRLKHSNIISYYDNCYQFIESTLFHASG